MILFMIIRFFPIFVVTLTAVSTFGQGVLVLDQYSWLDETPFPGSGTFITANANPWGQSFTPTLSAVDYVRFKFADGDRLQTGGATVHVNILSDSISGRLLASTEPVFMADGFAGVATFLFPASVPVVPGTVYYFTVAVHPGSDLWAIDSAGYNYPGGSGFWAGVAGAGDLWFQEGIVVPEPTVLWIALIGAGALAWKSRLNRKQ